MCVRTIQNKPKVILNIMFHLGPTLTKPSLYIFSDILASHGHVQMYTYETVDQTNSKGTC